MIGLLIASHPWLSEKPSIGPRQRFGEILTFALEDNTPLNVYFPHRLGVSMNRFIVTHEYDIEDVVAPSIEIGLCYEFEGSRIFRISDHDAA